MNVADKLAKTRDVLADVLAELGGWVAPVPTAFFTSQAGITLLHWPEWVAYVVGATVELLGISAISTWLSLREWNVTRRADQPRAPVHLATMVVASYVVCVTLLVLVLKLYPVLAQGAALLLPVLSLAGMMTLALRAEHRRRQVPAIPAPTMPAPAPIVAERSVKEHVLDCYRANPLATQASVAEAVGVSRQTVGNLLAEMAEHGAIRRNGHGVEVL